jgi:hypothetical protein
MMVNARLHIICGNCGCGDNFEYETGTRKDCEDITVGTDVCIACNNCATLHTLSDKMNEKSGPKLNLHTESR